MYLRNDLFLNRLPGINDSFYGLFFDGLQEVYIKKPSKC